MNFKQWINESPLSLNKIGDWDKEREYLQNKPARKGKTRYGWTLTDMSLLSQNRIEKIEKSWEKLPQQVDAYVVIGSKAHKFRQEGEIGLNFVRNELGITEEQWKGVNLWNKITVFFTQNKGGQKVPMTPWILAHRFAHALMGKGKNEFEELYKAFWVDSHELLSVVYGYELKGNDVFDKIFLNYVNSIGTMKSTRNKKINNVYEFFYEVFAQYIITGKIQFNKLPKYLGNSKVGYYRSKYDDLREQYDEKLESDADYYASKFNRFLDGCLGRTYLM